jgi:4-oxalocrotonate tautomerase
MPYLNFKLCASPSQHISTQIASALTDLTVEVLGKKREYTAVTVDYIAPEQWYIGGAPAAGSPHQTFYLDIKITEGTNTKDEKAMYVSRIFAAIEAIVGAVAPISYIVIHEVRADAWGYQGQTQELRYIKGKSL